MERTVVDVADEQVVDDGGFVSFVVARGDALWRSAWLLTLWIGIGAIFHGIADLITAFQVKAAR